MKIDIKVSENIVKSSEEMEIIIDNDNDYNKIMLLLNEIMGFRKNDKLIVAKDIYNAPKLHIGGVVTNYECELSEAVNKWRIFYADELNIFLIADKCISGVFMPEPFFSDYKGMTEISDSRVKKYFKCKAENKYFKVKCFDTIMSILNTDKWHEFKGEYAEYAIGSPTMDLFLQSYNAMHPECRIVFNRYRDMIYDEAGCEIRIKPTKSLYFDVDDKNTMYIATSLDKNTDFCGISRFDFVGNYQRLNEIDVDIKNRIFRPVVCLKSDVKLIKLTNGDYKIFNGIFEK